MPHTNHKLEDRADLEETQRKLAWRELMEEECPVIREKLIHYSMHPEAPLKYSSQFEAPIKKAHEFRNAVIKAHQSSQNVPKMFTANYWRTKLQDLCNDGSRFLQCDKNLGVRIINQSTYQRLAARESKNYEIAKKVDDSIRHEAIMEEVNQLRRVAGAIRYAKIHVTRLDDHETCRQALFLFDLSEYIKDSLQNKEFKFPQLRLLLKVHKPMKSDGLYATRPIVPNYSLPSYETAKWLGQFMSKMVKQIEWNLESTDQFIDFITNPMRTENVASFDFTNLYGNEPVKETLDLFFSSLYEMNWNFGIIDDQTTFDALMTPCECPEDVEIKKYFPNQTNVFMLLLATCINNTIADLDMGNGEVYILGTEKFLAMGCPPVAPLSIIALAYLEQKAFGRENCIRGLRRLIDDIIVDLSVVNESLLRSAYPSYLELNHGDRGHFLDVQYVWAGKAFMYFPYVKPHATIPLNAMSCHPWHVLRASVKNELYRLMRLCSHNVFRPAWRSYWYTKYERAGYSREWLSRIDFELSMKNSIPKTKVEDRGVNHVEVWRGVETDTVRQLRVHSQRNLSKAWKVERSLLSLALSAHKAKNT